MDPSEIACRDFDSTARVDTTNWSCLHCDYNLTGITQGRCPECGTPIDADIHKAIVNNAPFPRLSTEPASSPSFLGTLLFVATQPRVFARRFSPVPDLTLARQIGMFNYILAFSAYFFPTLLAAECGVLDSRLVCPMIGFTIPAFIAAYICESSIALLLSVLVAPIRARDCYDFWRAMLHYTSGFLITTAGLAAAALIILTNISPNGEPSAHLCLAILGFANATWWAVTVILLIHTRAKPGLGRVAGMVMVPVIGFAALILGLIICGIVAALRI